MRQATPSATRPAALPGRMWLAAALLGAATLPLHGQIWNQNLIVNGDAESGSGMSTIDPSRVVKTVPGWKTTGNFTVVQYGDSVGGIAPEDPGPVDRGNNYFAGGFGGATSSAAQTIDLSGGATEIDAGRVRFYLSGYLMIGSYVDSTRSPVLTATFKDGAGKVLLTSVVKGPTAAEGSDLQVRAISGFLLPNTRSVDLLLELTDPATGGRGDNFNLSSADNLSLFLTLEAVTGHNLVVNGDAETSPAKDGSFDSSYPVPGWNADANGTAWSQQIAVPFVTRLLEQRSILLTTPATVAPNPAADASCRWAQPLVIEEQGGYEVLLTTLTAGGADLSGQVQQIFGTTTLGPFGRLEGTLCWSSGAAAGAKSISVSGAMAEVPTNTVSDSESTTLATAAAAATASVSPASVTLPAGSSQSATVSLSFTGGSPAWTAAVSPANATTNWLTVSPLSGTGAAQLKLTASPGGLSKGVYRAVVLIQSTNAAPQFLSVPVALVVGGSSAISIGGVTNAASYKTVFAPGMLMTVFGANLAPAIQHAPSVPLPFTMQGITATVNGYSAPLLDVSPGQLNVQIPYEVGAGTAFLGVNNNGQVASFPFQVQASAPGIFMTLDGASNLIPYSTGQRGQVLLAFITGEGDVAPVLVTGRTPTTTDVTKLPAPGLPVSLTVGGVPAAIGFIGIPGGLVGATQINFTVPSNAPLGAQPVVVTVGGVSSAPVTLTVTN